MRRSLSLTLTLTVLLPALVALPAATARAQAVAAVSLERLREQYEQLLAIDRDPSTPPEVRQLNQTFLEERRAGLREAIKARIEAVRQYRSFAAASLTLDEKVTLEQSIRELEKQLRALGGEPRKAAGAGAQTPAKRTPPAPRAPRAANSSRPALVEAAAKDGPEPKPEPEDGKKENEPKPDEKKRPIVVVSQAEGEDASKGINVATREVELKIELNEPINDLQVSVFAGDEKKPKSVKMVEMNPTDQGKKSVVVQLTKGKNTISVDDLKRLSDADVEAKRIINYAPPEEGVVGDTGKSAPKPLKLSATTDKWTNVPEEGENVRVGYAAEAGKSYQFYVKRKNGGAPQTLDTTQTSVVSGVVAGVFARLDAGDRVGIVQVNGTNPVEDTRDEIAVESTFDETRGGPFGLMVGGVVMSQQAQQFQQADPFFGFTVGYMSKMRNAYESPRTCGSVRYIVDGFRRRPVFVAEDGTLVDDARQKIICKNKSAYEYAVDNGQRVVNQSKPQRNGGFDGWRWNLRFQGIFQSDPRTATAENTTETDNSGGTGGGTTNEPFTFIASRKTFDLNAQFWVDFWANSAFSIGPYAAVGFSTVLDKNELQGEAVTDGKATETAEGDDSNTDTVATQSTSDNDLKKYYEGGVLMNVMLNRDLFAQSILAYRRDEALAGLHPERSGCFGCNTRNRFAGKLRVFPMGLNRGFGRQVKMTPMFGVEVNAGRGPDHIKFFSGFAVRIKGINISEAAGPLAGGSTDTDTDKDKDKDSGGTPDDQN